jgi:hypothetical protein
VITIWRKLPDESWELVSSHETISEAQAQLFALRTGEGEYRAELREGSTSSILGL